MKYVLLLFCTFFLLSSTQAQTLHLVRSGNFFYNPNSLTISIGDTVRWINEGGFHNVNADVNTLTGNSYNNPESFSSSPTTDGVLLTRVFTVAGTYEYDCSVGSHAANGMVGTLIVEDNTTSTNEIQGKVSSLAVIYQPSSQNITITFDLRRTSDDAFVGISNFAGQNLEVTKINATAGFNNHQVNFGLNVPSGIYLVSLYVDGAVETKKIFVQ
ncbi:MAG: plastocyanin/azurin family copper-binding protein [Bacteroidota bacterium]